MWVTAYTDGSVRPGKSAWSIWLRSEKGRIVKGGECPPTVNDANVAELFAAKVAILEAHKEWHRDSEPLTGIQINSDNTVVVNSLYPWSPTHKNLQIKELQDEIRGFLSVTQIRIRVKHVKAHTGGTDTRSWINSQCDKIAKKNSKQQPNWRGNVNANGRSNKQNAKLGSGCSMPRPHADWRDRKAACAVRDGSVQGAAGNPSIALGDAPKELRD